MAVTVLLDVLTLLAGTSYETNIVKVTIDAAIVDLDTTAFGGSGWTTTVGGLKSGKISFDFNQDYTATTGLDAVFGLGGFFGTVQTFECRPTSAARSVGNAAHTGSVLIDGWQPINGKVGDLATLSVTWPATGPVLRATA